MAQLDQAPDSGPGFNPLEWLGSQLGRLVISVIVPGLLFVVLWQGFLFLRDSEAPQYLIAIIAIVWGVGGAAALYFVSNWVVERMGAEWTRRLQPFVFVGPAMAILAWFLAIPTLRTLWLSFFDRTSTEFVFLDNFIKIFSDPNLILVFRNNLLWIVFGASFSVILGLLIAVLADRSRYESLAKSLIFLPMAISFVGAGVIWNFIYEVKDISAPQIGLLNALWVGLGGEPQAWTALLQPWNNLFLIVIVIWLQTGYAMVLFSAAIKGIPSDLIEAARVDGATEVQIFFRIMIPYISGTIITVATTIVIFTLKIFDVVLVMTGGQFGTEVIATAFYKQNFTARNFGLGSAIAVVLLLLVIPIMIYNLRKFGEEEAFE